MHTKVYDKKRIWNILFNAHICVTTNSQTKEKTIIREQKSVNNVLDIVH